MSSAPLERLQALVWKVTGTRVPLDVSKMPGGASSRQFYRVRLVGGETAVAIFLPDATKSDEIVKVAEGTRRWPFLEVRDLLEGAGIRVPRLLGDASADGFLLVEDLGDDTLAVYLGRNPDRRTILYQTAVQDLARAQQALSVLPIESIVRERAFDFDLLRWELEHFREWGVEGRGFEQTVQQRAEYARICDALARRIAGWHRGFVHRDYQSRNIMVLQDRPREHLAWIDFQDALLGPRVYDLVALLGDSYQSFDEAFVQARLDEFASYLGVYGERDAIRREFDLVTVQRKLKDAGRFVYIDRVKGDSSYLRFVEPTLDKVLAALARLDDDVDMRALAELIRRWR